MTAHTVTETSTFAVLRSNKAAGMWFVAAGIYLLGWLIMALVGPGYSFTGVWQYVHLAFWGLMVIAFVMTFTPDINGTPWSRLGLIASILIVAVSLLMGLLPISALADNGEREEMDALAAAELDGSCANVSDSVNFFDAPDKRSPLATGPVLPMEVSELKPRIEGRVAQSAFQAVYYSVGLDPENIMGLKVDGAGSSDWITLLRGNAERHLDICQDVVRAIQLSDNAALVPDWRPEDGEAAYLVTTDRENLGWLELPVPEEGITALLWYPAYNEQDPDSIRPIVFLPEWGVFAADDPIGDIPTIQGGVDDFYGGEEGEEQNEEPVVSTTTVVVNEGEDGTAVTQAPDGSTVPTEEPDEEQPSGDDTGDTTGPGDQDDGTTGQPGGGGECQDGPGCPGENEGPGGGGDDEEGDCPGCPGDGDGGGDDGDKDKCPTDCPKPTPTTSPPPTQPPTTSPPTTQPPPTTTTTTKPTTTTTTKPTTTTTVPKPVWSAKLVCDISGTLAKWVLDITASGTPATFSPSDGTSWLVRDVGTSFSVTVTALWSGGSESRTVSASGECGKNADENPPPPPPP